MELDHTGGTYGGNRMPTPFLCLALKMLQIQPDKDIVVEFIKNEDYKYVRVLGAFYLRLTGTFADIYQYLEPLYNDYRKIRHKLGDGKFALTHVDEFIDELLTKDYSCDTALPRIQKRLVIDKETGKPKGYGFCEYKDEETALSARRNLQGYEINGRQLCVDFAENGRNTDRNREKVEDCKSYVKLKACIALVP